MVHRRAPLPTIFRREVPRLGHWMVGAGYKKIYVQLLPGEQDRAGVRMRV